MIVTGRRGGRRLSTFSADVRGATLVEFAIIAVPFVALLLAILQTSLIYFVQETLETTVESAGRSIVTGQRQALDVTGTAQGLTKAQLAERFRKAGCAAMPAFLSCSRLYVEVKSAANWGSADATLPTLTYDANGRITNGFTYDLGGQGSIVVVRFMYLWPIQGAPMFRLDNAPASQRLLLATSVAKSESYS